MPKPADWLYARVARMLPAQMWDAVGGDLVQGFRDQCRAAAERGPASLVRVWLRGFLNLCWTVIAERWLLVSAYFGERENGGMWGMGTIVQDLKFAIRTLLRAPTYTVIVLTTLTVGIGATTAIFSVVDAVLLRQLPYPDADELLQVWGRNESIGFMEDLTSWPTYSEWRDQSQTLEGLAAVSRFGANLTGEGNPVRLRGSIVTPSFFSILGVEPLLGEVFDEETAVEGADRVVVLGHATWQQSFGSDPGVLGRTIQLNRESFTVVGVMPQGFDFPEASALWRPMALSADQRERRGQFFLATVGRMRDGVILSQAQADLARVGQLQREATGNEQLDVTVNGLHQQLVGDVRSSLLLMFAAVGFVLLIACANVANMVLARGLGRGGEMSLRAALGAGRRRIIQQLLTENLLLAAVALPSGLLVAWLGIRALPALAPEGFPMLGDVAVNGQVLMFIAAVTLFAGVFFGTGPAIWSVGADLRRGLSSGGGRGNSGSKGLRSPLVVAEIALAVVLLVSSGLLIRSFQAVNTVDPGFETEGLVAMNLALPRAAYPEEQAVVQFYSQLIENIESLPGVERAAAGSSLLVSDFPTSGGIAIEGRPPLEDSEAIEVLIDAVTPGYFTTLGTPLVVGRDFQRSDAGDGPPVVVINESMARRFWPNQDPLGQRFTYGGGGDGATWLTIVGVVGDVRRSGNDQDVRAASYLMHGGFYTPSSMSVMVRTRLDPASMVASIRAQVWELDAAQPVTSVTPVTTLLAARVADRRFATTLLGVFAGVALFLALGGVYGVMAYTVAQRTREIGVRLALGAQRRDVLRMVLRQGLMLVAGGAALGGLGAVAVGRLLESQLFGVTPLDPITLVGAATALAVSAMAAIYVPARRATRVESVIAMRE